MVDPSTYFSDDQMISIALVAGLLLVSKLRDMLDLSGMLAAMVVGLTVSLLGHWTWLIILVIFLFVASIATKWRFEEKRALSIQESNEGARGWRNVMANGAAASMVTILGWFGDGDWYFLACLLYTSDAADE